MSTKTSTRNIVFSAKDKETSTLMAMIRTIRSVAMGIRAITLLVEAISVMEDEATLGVGALSRIVRYSLLGVAAGASIYVGASLVEQQGGGILPVGQTQPGQYRMVQATGPAILDRGEIISRPTKNDVSPGRGGINIKKLTISKEGLPADQAFTRIRERLRNMGQ